MKVWRTLPFLRLLIPFVMGIVLSSALPNIHISTNLLFVGFILQVIATGVTGHTSFFRWQSLFGLMLHLELVFLGMAIADSHNMDSDPFNIKNQYHPGDSVVACLDAPLSKTKTGYRTILSVQGIRRDHQVVPARGRLLAYFHEDSASTHLPYGSVVCIGSRLTEISFSGNPHVFNYRDYMKRKGVHFRTYIDNITCKKAHRRHNAKTISCSIRDQALNIIRKSGLDQTSSDIMSALMLGDKSGLDPQLKSSFGRAGASHILAVSGLHVGIIYLILAFVLQPLSGFKSGRLFSVVLTIITLWFYAFLTGLQPSVCRAVIMFSFVRTGILFNRGAHPLNILATSAFFTLAFQPTWLFDPGFQLSYGAVAGILILYQPLYRIFTFRNTLVDRLWALTCVSLAAQCTTFPLVLYYFHQFPVYFILSNLVVIPLCAAILYCGIVMIALSWWAWAYHSLSWVATKIIWMMNSGVGVVGHLPGSVVTVHPDALTVMLLYISLITTIRWLSLPRFRYLIVSMVVWIGLSCYSLQREYKTYYTHRIAVLNLRHGRSLHFSYHGKNWLAMDAAALADTNQYRYQILPGKVGEWQPWQEDSVKMVPDNKTLKIVFDGQHVTLNQSSLRMVPKASISRQSIDDERSVPYTEQASSNLCWR